MSEKVEAERAVGLLVVDDGYTLKGVCSDEENKRPEVVIVYRPALPEAVYDYQIKSTAAKNGAERLEAMLSHLSGHVDSWSGVVRRKSGVNLAVPWKDGKTLALATPSVRTAVGTDYLQQMVNYVNGYTPGQWEEDAGNS